MGDDRRFSPDGPLPAAGLAVEQARPGPQPLPDPDHPEASVVPLRIATPTPSPCASPPSRPRWRPCPAPSPRPRPSPEPPDRPRPRERQLLPTAAGTTRLARPCAPRATPPPSASPPSPRACACPASACTCATPAATPRANSAPPGQARQPGGNPHPALAPQPRRRRRQRGPWALSRLPALQALPDQPWWLVCASPRAACCGTPTATARPAQTAPAIAAPAAPGCPSIRPPRPLAASARRRARPGTLTHARPSRTTAPPGPRRRPARRAGSADRARRRAPLRHRPGGPARPAPRVRSAGWADDMPIRDPAFLGWQGTLAPRPGHPLDFPLPDAAPGELAEVHARPAGCSPPATPTCWTAAPCASSSPPAGPVLARTRGARCAGYRERRSGWIDLELRVWTKDIAVADNLLARGLAAVLAALADINAIDLAGAPPRLALRLTKPQGEPGPSPAGSTRPPPPGNSAWPAAPSAASWSWASRPRRTRPRRPHRRGGRGAAPALEGGLGRGSLTPPRRPAAAGPPASWPRGPARNLVASPGFHDSAEPYRGASEHGF